MAATTTTTTTTAARQRRVRREQRREMIAGSGERSADSPPRGDSRSESAAVSDSVRQRVRQTSPGTAALVGAAVGLLAGAVVEKSRRNDGNEISGDVAVHLLNRIELLTIRLQVRQARRGGPADINVHRVPANASSRP